MQYLSVPRTITHADVVNRGMALSPSMYRRVEIPSRRTVEMRDLLAAWCNGEEVGSIAHVLKSPYRFIRTKAIQSESALSQFRGDAVGYIAPWAYYDAIAKEPCRSVVDGDIIYARGGNVGEVAIAEGCGQAIPSSHTIKIMLREKKWYVFAFLKHEICKLQQRTQQTGAIKALDNFKIEQLLSCQVPFPDQVESERVEQYVAALMETIVDKERSIRSRHEAILHSIDEELGHSKPGAEFVYSHPTLAEVSLTTRLDTGLYCWGFRAFKHRVDTYRHGATTLSAMGERGLLDANFTDPRLLCSELGEVRKLDRASKFQVWTSALGVKVLQDKGLLTDACKLVYH